MARMKKTSKVVEEAKERLSGLKAIANLNLGGAITLAAYEQSIDEAEDSLETYNTSLSVADDNQDKFEIREKALKDKHERILLAVGSAYGKDSIEYAQAGGTRKSERKKPSRAKSKEDK